MQPPIDTLFLSTPEVGTVLPAGNLDTSGAEVPEDLFFNLLQLPPQELPVRLAVQAEIEGGSSLPPEGKVLPTATPRLPLVERDVVAVTTDRSLLTRHAGVIGSQVEPAASDRNIDTMYLPGKKAASRFGRDIGQPIARSGSEAGQPIARPGGEKGPAIARFERRSSMPDVRHAIAATVARPGTSDRPVGHIPGADSFVSASKTDAAALNPDRLDLLRVPNGQIGDSERLQVRPESGLPSSSSLPERHVRADIRSQDAEVSQKPVVRPVVTEAVSPLPLSVVRLGQGDEIVWPSSVIKDRRVALVDKMEDRRVADLRPANRIDPTKSAISGVLDKQADTVGGIVHEQATPKTVTEGPGSKFSLSVSLPPLPASTVGVPPVAANPALSTPAMPTVASVDVPVLDPAWADALQDRVLWLANKNIQSAQIRLSPAELGPLTVQISVDDKSTNISFTATHPATREALEMALPRLRDMLAESGMSLSDANVSDQGIANQDNRSSHTSPGEVDPVDEDSMQITDPPPNSKSAKDPSSLVDTYV